MDRHWNGERWFTEDEMDRAREEAILAIDEYYNGDRIEAEKWLLTAYDANKDRRAREENR